MNMSSSFFNPGPFMPHGGCYLWTQSLIALHTVSDALIVLSYYSIPIALVYFVRKRKDLKFNWMFVCFAVFILACGTTHLMEIWNIWHGDYWLSGAIKAVTALASVSTALLLFKLIPRALALPGPGALEAAYAEMEGRVIERTAELTRTTRDLQAEIAEHKRTEQALRESEDLFSKGFRLSPDCMVISRLCDRTVIRANESLCRLWRTTPEEIIGRPSLEYTTWANEEARQAFLKTLRETGECVNQEAALRMADGRLLDFIISSRLMSLQGEPCVLTSMLDITARKVLEQERARLAQLIEHSRDFIATADLEGRITFMNSGARHMIGMAEGSDPRDLSFTDYVPPEWHDFFRRQVIGTALEKGVREGEMQLRHLQTGALIDVFRTTFLLRDAEGRPESFATVTRDITESKRSEMALRESEIRMRLATEATAVGIWEWNVLTNRILWDAQMFRIHGVTPTRDGFVDYAVWRNAVLPEDLDRTEEKLRQTLKMGGAGFREFRIRRSNDRETRHIQAVETVRMNAQGQAEWVVGTNLDITRRKQADLALQESEERFRTMANSIPQLAWIARADGHISWYNRRWYEYTGATPAQMEGWGWQRAHDPSVLPDVMEKWKVSLATGTPMDMEFPLRGADGRFRAFLTRVEPLKDSEGRVVQWFGTNTDVETLKQAEEKVRLLNADLERRVAERTAQLEVANTELRQSRAELNGLFESLPGLYLILTPELRIVGVSNAYLKATMTTRDGILGRGLFEVFPDNPDDASASGAANLRASMERVLQSGSAETMSIQRYDIRRPDGVYEEHYWSPINSPVFGEHRQVKYIVHRVEDVTEFVLKKPSPSSSDAEELSDRVQRMEAEIFQSSQKVQAINLQLEASNKDLEAFSYSVSHDLRAPLRAVNGFAVIVLEEFGDKMPAEARRHLERIRKGGQQMGELIDDLLAFSRLSRQHLKRQPVDAALLVQNVLDDLVPQHEGRRISFKVGPLPECRGDAALLRQVWVNLLSNAIKYTRGRDPAQIEIGFETGGGEGVYFVRDNGTGFDMQYAHKLFGVFQRLHRAEEFEGTGVGLAIVHRIVHRHGGRVWAEAEVGKGAVFRFTLEPKK